MRWWKQSVRFDEPSTPTKKNRMQFDVRLRKREKLEIFLSAHNPMPSAGRRRRRAASK